MNKLNALPALPVFFPLILLPSLSITTEVTFEPKLLTNPDKLPLAKGIARSIITFYPTL